MERFHCPPGAGNVEVKNFLNSSFPYRAFHCHNCRVYLTVCSRCDRNLIYCPTCRVEKKKIRNRKSSKNYRSTTHGRRKRALNERRRRARRREFVANRGSPPEQIQSVPPVPAIHGGPNKGGESDEISTAAEGPFKEPLEIRTSIQTDRGRQVSKKTFCSFCHCECSEFQRFWTGYHWRKEKKKFAGKSRGNLSTS